MTESRKHWRKCKQIWRKKSKKLEWQVSQTDKRTSKQTRRRPIVRVLDKYVPVLRYYVGVRLLGHEIWPRHIVIGNLNSCSCVCMCLHACVSPKGIMTLHHLVISQLSHLINTASLIVLCQPFSLWVNLENNCLGKTICIKAETKSI